jgi:hypothetical protein
MASSDTFRAQEISIITQIASMIVESAKGFASWSKTIKNAFQISAASETPTGVTITISNSAPEAHAFEVGSGIHGPTGEKYDIVPVNAGALSFPGTHAWEGQTIITQHVSHPGVAARPFLHPANEAVRPQAMAMLKQAFGETVRMAIKEAWNNK